MLSPDFSRKQIVYISQAIGLLSLGSVVYLLWRADSLLMFRWFENLGMRPFLFVLRSKFPKPNGDLASAFVQSAPFALWVMSFLLCVRAIWFESSSLVRHVWFWSVPVVALTAELLQGANMLPGTFDVVDMLFILVAVVIVLEKKTLRGTSRNQRKGTIQNVHHCS